MTSSSPPPDRSRPVVFGRLRNHAVPIVLVAALIPRLIVAVLLTTRYPRRTTEYDVIAEIMRTHGFFGFDFYGFTKAEIGSFMPPLYPALLWAAEALWTGHGRLLLALLQVALSVWGCWLAHALADEIWKNRRISLVAMILAALHFPLVVYCGAISTAVLDVVLVQAALVYGLRAVKRDRLPEAVVAGVMIGLATLTRTPGLLVLFALLAAALFSSLPGRRAIRLGVVLMAVTAACVAPWTIRNLAVHHRPVLVSTNGGFNFWVGNGPGATGEFRMPPDSLMARAAERREVERGRFFQNDAIAFMRENPAAWRAAMTGKVRNLLWFRPNMGASFKKLGGDVARGGRLPYKLSYAALLTLTVPGLWLSRGRWRQLVPLYVTVAGVGATTMAYFAATRFRMPVEALMTAFAAVTVVRVLDGIDAWRGKRRR